MKLIPIASVILAGLIAVFTVGLLVSQRSIAPAIPADKLVVAATIFPLADIARNVGGDRVHIIQILPPGASPHSYTFTPQQLANIDQAKALFVIGHGLDDWAVSAVAAANIPAITVDRSIELRKFSTEHEREEEEAEKENKKSSIDPHYWLTVPNGQAIARTVAATLQELDPANSQSYASNLQNYLASLDALEAELQSQTRAAEHKEFIAIHDAWSYFAEQYGLNLVSTYEPVEGKTPTIADLNNLQRLVTEHRLDTFFTEPQKQSSSAIRFLQNELGLVIEVLDPVGGPPPRDSFANLLRANLLAIIQ